MASPEHLKALASGAAGWNAWRRGRTRRGDGTPDLRSARLAGKDLRRFDLRGADLRRADLRRAWLRGAQLSHADLRSADLRRARLLESDLSRADLRGADLRDANLEGARLTSADLSGADLRRAIVKFALLSRADLTGADLRRADLRCSSLRRARLRRADLGGAILRHTSLAEADLAGARLAGAEVYGAGVWGIRGRPADQRGLVVAADLESPALSIDDLDTAQFLFVLLENARIADVIDAASSRVVLLLGRFTAARKRVLAALKDHLLRRQLVPIVFDFARPHARDLTETVASLANMSCFVVADLSGARSVPQELSHIVPLLPSVPIAPILAAGRRAYAMFEHFQRYRWVRPVVRYRTVEHLLRIVDREVIDPAYRDAMRPRGVARPRLPKAAPDGAGEPRAPRTKPRPLARPGLRRAAGLRAT